MTTIHTQWPSQAHTDNDGDQYGTLDQPLVFWPDDYLHPNGDRITVGLVFTNMYELYPTITVTKYLLVPAPTGNVLTDHKDWISDTVFELTGTGRSSGDSWYTVKVIASSAPDLVPVGVELPV